MKLSSSLVVLQLKLFSISLLIFSSLSVLAAAPKDYSVQLAWKDIQTFLPERLRFDDRYHPRESWWQWHGHDVHLDRFDSPSAPALVILLHGVGTNGRQMSLIAGGPLARQGFATVALDLPGYGVTRVGDQEKVTYDSWVQLVSDFIDEQRRENDRPVFLYGLSAGGMLSYHVAALNRNVDGIIGMTFLDQRDALIRHATARNKFISMVGRPMLWASDNPISGGIKFPLRLVSKMNALVNDDDALSVFLNDESSAGNWVSVRFVRSYITYQPVIEPENFSLCPILLTQPAMDRWTPLALSQPFMNKLPEGVGRTVMLDNAGHYPLEEPGLSQLDTAMAEFIRARLSVLSVASSSDKMNKLQGEGLTF